MNRPSFNLSDWALHHRSLVWFLLIVSMVAGTLSYLRLGREEDPNFTVKVMVISASLPGATITDTLNQVTTRIETKLEELDELKFTRSVTMPGQSVVYLELDPTIRGPQVPEVWKRVRNMMSDLRPEFPQEFGGFQFNDDFGDVYGNIYAFTADGFTHRELRDRVEDIRKQVQALPMAGKTSLLGVRKEEIYIEFSLARLSALGLNHNQVVQSLATQNAIAPSGIVQAGPEQVLVRVSGQFDDAASIAAVNLRVGDRFFNIGDVAVVRRGYEDPPSALFRHDGRDAIGMQIGMRDGGNILEFGKQVDALMEQVGRNLPIGIEMAKFADQPHVVKDAVGHFVRALIEAVGIVLLVSFISLGLRAGLVVTLTIPLVLAITFVILDVYGITLQRISLGALIIALGLLVDDAMIAIETMISRLEVGESLEHAASYAWTSIAFPMLTGTLVTVAGFIPIGLNSSAAGEFTFSLFVVIAVSLLVSWIVAVLFAPLLGATLLSPSTTHKEQRAGLLRRVFHRLLLWGMRFRWTTIAVTLAAFLLSVWGMRFVEQQFFPTSDRTELIVDVTERANASIAKTDESIARLEAFLKTQEEALFFTSYIGRGAPRFILSMDVPTPGPYMGQILIQTPDLAARDRLTAAIVDFSTPQAAARTSMSRTWKWPPGRQACAIPRVFARPAGGARCRPRPGGGAVTRAAAARHRPRLERTGRVVRLRVNQDLARKLGISSEDISAALAGTFTGRAITQLRDGIFLINIVARGSDADRTSLESIQNLQLATATGTPIPIAALARLEYATEQPLIMQRDGLPTVTVKADIASGEQPATLVNDLAGRIAEFQASLPDQVRITVGGTVETSAESQQPIAAVVPIMLLIMALLVMIQMQSFRLSLIVFAAAPLGVIGVVAALLPFGVPMGFVAILGILALIGILIRNSVILVHEIQVLIGKGHSQWQAVFEASDSRARPILLTAAAASLALIPISRQVFWGPMAFAMMGGIIAGTLVTLVFVPALYCAVFGVEPPEDQPAGQEKASAS
ncbi:efflux RND transporter permease subunit [Paracoccus mutanolyticus]|uniref:efflux RND transporter permease subunit n=1 Tax=Paracoccus mutanolyticus TaxID=1499308 RepID=UPI001CB9AB62|nr:efflux RND transporter permease subunit [Paracoccus mutanolyticus]